MKLIALIFVLSLQAQAAISVNTVWEVRTAGADTNGGGFVTGASGSDYSQNDNKNAAACSSCGSSSVNLSKTDAVTAGTTTITSATANFSSAIEGNIINVSGGTGAVTSGWYQVVTFTNSTTIVVDRSTGLTAGTGATINIGGALLTIAQLVASTNMALGHTAYVKSGTYTQTTATTVATSCLGASATAQNICSINGYGSTRSDGGARPLLTTATNSITLFNLNGAAGITWNHLSFSNTAGTRANGFNATGASYYQTFLDCVFDGFTVALLGNWNVNETIRGLSILNTEIKNCTSTSGAVLNTDGALIFGSYLHANVVAWGRLANSAFTKPMIARYTVFASNTGSSNGAGLVISNGASGTATYTVDIDHCVFWTNTGSGILQGDGAVMVSVQNTIFDSNTRYGWEVITANSNDPPYSILNQNNFYYNNTLGTRLNVAAGTGDVTSASASPFVAAGSANFALNSTAGAGTLAKAAGFPGVTTWIGTGYADIGPLQTASPSTQRAYGSGQ